MLYFPETVSWKCIFFLLEMPLLVVIDVLLTLSLYIIYFFVTTFFAVFVRKYHNPKYPLNTFRLIPDKRHVDLSENQHTSCKVLYFLSDSLGLHIYLYLQSALHYLSTLFVLYLKKNNNV